MKDRIVDDNIYLEILHILFDLPVTLTCYDMLFEKQLQHGSLNLNEFWKELIRLLY
jgi:hypothetical protein